MSHRSIPVIRLPIFPEPPRSGDMARLLDWANQVKQWAGRLAQEIETYSDVARTAAPGVYTVTNDTEDRTFDADSTSTAELADVLATVISDLQHKGILE